MAHKWVGKLHNTCHLGGPKTLKSGGQHNKWPTSGPMSYITLALSEVHDPFTAGETIISRPQVGGLATWPPPRVRGPHCFKASDKIQK